MSDLCASSTGEVRQVKRFSPERGSRFDGIYLLRFGAFRCSPPSGGRAGARAQDGDTALDELVRRNLRFVVSVAKQYRAACAFEISINEGMSPHPAAKRSTWSAATGSFYAGGDQAGDLQHLGENPARCGCRSQTTRHPNHARVAAFGQELGRDPTSDELPSDAPPPAGVDVCSTSGEAILDRDPIEGHDNAFYVETLRDEERRARRGVVRDDACRDIELRWRSLIRAKKHSARTTGGRRAPPRSSRWHAYTLTRERSANPDRAILSTAQFAEDGVVAGVLHQLNCCNTSGSSSPGRFERPGSLFFPNLLEHSCGLGPLKSARPIMI